MDQLLKLRFSAAVPALLMVCSAGAATIIHLTLDEMTGRSELIVSGQVTSSFMAWDSEHKYIWTHYIVTVNSAVKGTAARTVEIAEPGGVVSNIGMNISGAAGYSRGERVLVFLERMPNGYLRTAGLGQGKYGIDAQGRLHGIALKDADVVSGGSSTGASVHSLDGMTVTEASGYLAARTAKGVR